MGVIINGASGFTNPMTTAADIIVGGSGGAAARLAKGSALQVLKVNAGATALEWAADASGFANPMTTRGDLIRGGVAGAAERVAAVTNGHVVGGDGTDVVSRAIATTLAVDAATNCAAIGALPLAGGTMLGAIAMGNAKITGSVVPTAAGEAMVVPASVANVDLFYWVGGTLVRLPKGSALQALRVNAGATALEYATLSSTPPPTPLHASGATTNTGATTAIGRFRLNPAQWALSGLTPAYTFGIVGKVSAAITATVAVFALPTAAWDSGTTYAAGACVTSGGSDWRALRAVSSGGSAPAENADWSTAAVATVTFTTTFVTFASAVIPATGVAPTVAMNLEARASHNGSQGVDITTLSDGTCAVTWS